MHSHQRAWFMQLSFLRHHIVRSWGSLELLHSRGIAQPAVPTELTTATHEPVSIAPLANEASPDQTSLIDSSNVSLNASSTASLNDSEKKGRGAFSFSTISCITGQVLCIRHPQELGNTVWRQVACGSSFHDCVYPLHTCAA
jgi:hypothetical protein